jgi:hypothetical protein
MTTCLQKLSARIACASLAALGLCLGAAGAQAQGCTVTALNDPPREVLTCRGGLTLTAEKGTAYRLVDRNKDGTPEGAELTDKGLLVEVPPGGTRTRFQIRTPHAIASVRGTIWATDVTAARTSVFVARGAVAVRPPASRRAATLQAGEGVDVEADTTNPEVKRWGAQRAAALLARFGR